ncbi:MAG: hypothetical protein EAZ21_06900 [Betaproteobacteria bacterium]|nr:MAG: hypothetical protein EAZ21_06900 [Betaproteobacteria bacterium]
MAKAIIGSLHAVNIGDHQKRFCTGARTERSMMFGEIEKTAPVMEPCEGIGDRQLSRLLLCRAQVLVGFVEGDLQTPLLGNVAAFGD